MINLVTKFTPYVDEMFTTESKKDLVTNQDFDWTGAHTIKIYKINTSAMNDYDRAGTGSGATGSRYGKVASLNATTEEMTLTKDRSFTFAIDKLDTDETAQQLAGATALARQQREVIIPEVDTYTFNTMVTKAGTKASEVQLTPANIYEEILKGSEVLDDNEVPDSERCLVVTPTTYKLLKQSADIILNTDVTAEMRLKGVIAMIDGLQVIKVPAKRLPENFGFMLCHKVATVSPVKLEDYTIHENPVGISGALVEGRVVYDCFVLDNKAKAIYYQPVTKA